MSGPGRLIVFEGGEGAGKSTQARFAVQWLEERGRRVQLTREPGGSPLAEAIRGVVLASWNEGVCALTEALLIFAARAAHLRATIQPALLAGSDVVCDRFVDASYAYQGAGRGMPIEQLAQLERMVLGELAPDLVIVLDLDPAIAMPRIENRAGNNRFDSEDADFMHRVRAAYLQRAVADPARYAVLDAGLSLDVVQQHLEQVLETRL